MASLRIRKPRIRTIERLRCWCLLLAIWFLMLPPDFITALKDVSVTIPQAVKRGSNALLTCNYDMENDTLYSVKWYKGRREFYRYTPKENPAMKVFPMTSGLNVERNLSNQSHVVLLAVPLNISGKFTCEISVEAPSFQTAMVSGEMEVVELPEQQAIVTGIQPRYRIGDLVDGNCSIKFSKPAANLTWTINGIVVPPHHIKTYQIEKYEDNNLESVVSAIHFMVTTQHFLKGQMRLKCTATIFDIFKEEIESIIEEDRPRIMASGRSYDINNYPYEQHSSGDGFEDHNESYLTYYSAADITSAASASNMKIFLQTIHWYFRHMSNTLYTSSRTCVMRIIRKLQQNILTPLQSGITKQNVQQSLAVVWQCISSNSNSRCNNTNAYINTDCNSHHRQYHQQQELMNSGISVAVIIIAIILTHHLKCCQNRASVRTTAVAAGTLLSDTSLVMAAKRPPTLTPSATKSKCWKYFHNCNTATAMVDATVVITAVAIVFTAKDNAKDDDDDYDDDYDDDEVISASSLQKCQKKCHQCEQNQNGIATSAIIAFIDASCQHRQQQLKQQHQLSGTHVSATLNCFEECNFAIIVNDLKLWLLLLFLVLLLQPKDQTLLMTVQQQQQQKNLDFFTTTTTTTATIHTSKMAFLLETSCQSEC